MKVHDHLTFEVFLQALRAANVRLAKVANYGFTEPDPVRGGAVAIIPKVRVVATAVDLAAGVLHRWEQVQISRALGVTATATRPKPRAKPVVWFEYGRVEGRLELEGIVVSDGEWRPEQIDRLLAGSAR